MNELRYEDGGVKGINAAYIGGGSRGWAWGFMRDLAADRRMEGEVRLYDIDRKAARNNAVIGARISAHSDAASKWVYVTSGSLREALTGADIVVISILPATFKEMESDVHAPERYGVWQSVGDTVGPGGFMRAMRAIPMYVEIAEAIRDYAPKAWVINYTNPMGVCMRTLYEVFPEIKAFGCCHEVFGAQKLLADMLADLRGITGVSRREIKVNVSGLNHFTWFDSASYKGMDLFPLYEEFIQKYYETGFAEKDDNWMNNSFECAHRVKFDLFRRYGLIAAAGDRHLAEFMPNVYLTSPETVKGWKFGLTSVKWRFDDLEKRLAISESLVRGDTPVEITPSGEEGHLLIKALLGLGDLVSNVNLPNKGQIENLPREVVVETNAIFRGGEIRPVLAGALPPNLLPIVAEHAHNQENTVKAGLFCDYKLGLSTFANDPSMRNVNLADAEELYISMLKAQEAYLPEPWRKYVGL
ncbi:MAG: alpha-glucosidase/alpha-galactosidase [Clostridiales bacterium]|jgi:alpha-galactosidase|nr:alpha-glucosidase/alpha-galactosidase [Clostridiales bacterium]